MNMFKPVKAKSIEEYMHLVPEVRRESVQFLHQFIQESSNKLTPHLAYNMLGYGKFKYLNYKKDEIDWPIVALANQKNYISLYVCALENGEYIAEKYKAKLGKVSVGKSCIRFKRIDDVNLSVLKEIIKKAATNPGLVKS